MEKDKEKQNMFQKILKRKKLLIIVTILVVAGVGYYKYKSGQGNKIESVNVERGEVLDELVLSGEVNAQDYAKLTFPTSGRIDWVGVKEGDNVKKGQGLVKLDTTTLNSAFQQARSSLRAAEATVEKVHDQVKDHAGDETFTQKDTRTTAEAAKDEAYDAYIAAEYNLRNATLISPFAGIVTYLAHTFSGENVLLSETQVEVINPETIYFDVSADQNDVIKIKVGQEVNIILDSLPDTPLKGKIDFIGYTPKGGEAGTEYKVRVKFDTGNFDLTKYRVGMSGDARIVINSKENVLYLPPKFVKSDTNGKYVRLQSKNGKTYIKIGIESEDKVEILEGVSEGQTIYD